MTTVLLTGMPRSGTTLACALLNEHPDTVALAEPIEMALHGVRQRALAEIDAFLTMTRQGLLRDGTAPSKHRGGVVPDNVVEADHAPHGHLRPSLVLHGLIHPGKALSRDFRLVVKHPALFTALARDLARRYPLYAIIRDPLSVLASWQTVDININRGALPIAEAFAPRLAASMAIARTTLERQVIAMDWQLRTYLALPAGRVIRYEDMLADPAASLAQISGVVHAPSRPRQPYDARTRYASVPLRPLARALRPLLPLVRVFYPDFATTLAIAEDEGGDTIAPPALPALRPAQRHGGAPA